MPAHGAYGRYVCTNADGSPTVLGRNGSDYSGTIFGALLRSIHVTIWTDVDGVYRSGRAAAAAAATAAAAAAAADSARAMLAAARCNMLYRGLQHVVPRVATCCTVGCNLLYRGLQHVVPWVAAVASARAMLAAAHSSSHQCTATLRVGPAGESGSSAYRAAEVESTLRSPRALDMHSRGAVRVQCGPAARARGVCA